MTLRGTGDPILEGLRRLPGAEPGARSTARTRARSHAILARARQHREASKRALAARAIDGALVLVCLVYLSGAVAQALRLIDAIR